MFTEQNYDIGDRELLDIKLVLEEWRQWLEGTAQPFTVWIDHKNLAYLQSAKRLNARQARWALFFTRFSFSITYWPGSQNVKLDALSHQFSPSEEARVETLVFPRGCVIGELPWEIESAVWQHTEPDPGTGPPDRLYVPSSVQAQVLQWARFSCHPGIQRTISFLGACSGDFSSRCPRVCKSLHHLSPK